MLFPPRATPPRNRQMRTKRPTRAARRRAEHRHQRRVPTALDAYRGLPTGLTRIAETAEAKAAALRDSQHAGLTAAPHHVSADWRPPGSSAVKAHDYPSSPGSSWPSLRPTHRRARRSERQSLHPSLRIRPARQSRPGSRQTTRKRRRTTRTEQRTRPLRLLRQARPRRPQDHHRTNQRDLRRMHRPLRRDPRRRTRRRLARALQMNAKLRLSANELSDGPATMLADMSASKKANNPASMFASKRAGRITTSQRETETR